MKSAALPLDRTAPSGWWAKRQQLLMEKVLAPLAHAQRGVLSVTLPNGSTMTLGQHPCEDLNPAITLNNWNCIKKAFTGGAIGWGEAFMDGDWECADIAVLVEWIARNEGDFGDMLASGRWQRLLQRWQHRRNANSKRGSRRNIAYHYDLGNDFYRQWLDSSMTYSAAIFRSGEDSLEQAQHNKYQRIIDELAIGDGDRVLEVGCGWGGFAEQLCRQVDARLHGVTLSREQLDYARQRIARAGLEEHAEFHLTDYRDIEGHYDFIVSIEMLEAVGEDYWPSYFSTLMKRLRPGGKAAIQVITIDESRFEGYRREPDFIQTYIFPGGMLPSPTAFREQAGNAGFTIDSEFNFGLDYARTLAAWADAFNKQWQDIVPLGFDTRFQRMWQYYLGYCEGGFRAESIDVYQFVLSKPA
ncbi:MAG: class I SAM-dependent methyltransferase [Spongiibacter sp.]